MAKEVSVPESEAKWEAESDARALAEAKVIMGDKARLKKAAEAAKCMAVDKMDEAKAMKQVAKKASKKADKKVPSRKKK